MFWSFNNFYNSYILKEIKKKKRKEKITHKDKKKRESIFFWYLIKKISLTTCQQSKNDFLLNNLVVTLLIHSQVWVEIEMKRLTSKVKYIFYIYWVKVIIKKIKTTFVDENIL